MIKILLDPRGEDESIDHSMVVVSGTMDQIISELGFAIADIYNVLKQRSPVDAEIFRVMMGYATDSSSPTWSLKTTTPGSVMTVLLGNEIQNRRDK